MSDTKPLTERLRTDAIFDNTTLGNEAADALEAQALQLDVQAGSIEAVQAANQRLAAEVAEHKENAMRNARIAVSIRAERDQLQSKLGDAIQSSAHWQHQCTELQSRLDGMGKGEPVAWQFRTNGKHWHVVQVCPPDDAYDKGTLSPLYAAPKALAPEKGTELFDAWCDKSYADGMLLGWNLCESNHPETFQQLRSTRTEAALKVILANRAAHGIGGTP